MWSVEENNSCEFGLGDIETNAILTTTKKNESNKVLQCDVPHFIPTSSIMLFCQCEVCVSELQLQNYKAAMEMY